MSRQPGATDTPNIDQATADVLALVESALRERKHAAAVRSAEMHQPWVWVLGGITLALLCGMLVWPTGTLASRLHAIVRGVCDQRHMLAMGGLILPLDARCTGIYTGFVATLSYFVMLGRGAAQRTPPRSIGIVLGSAIALMGLDGFNSVLQQIGSDQLYPPHNMLRLASGLGCGVAIAGFGLPLFNGTFSANRRSNQRVVASWREFLTVLSIVAMLFILLSLGPAGVFYPVAIVSVFGIVGVLFLVNLAIVSLLSGLRQHVLLLRQLTVPATLSIVVTGLELTGLAWIRDRADSSVLAMIWRLF